MKKVVLVTGASRGIGRATAIKFASSGYDVIINYIDNERDVFHKPNIDNEQDAQNLKKYIEQKYGVKATTILADVSNEKEVKNMFAIIKKNYGKLDALVNNAGIVFDREFNAIKIYEMQRTLNVNVVGAFIVSREAGKILKKGGTIVNVSSTNGTKVISPESLDYNISKVGLQSLTRDLAYYYKPNIRVNAIAIGWADTALNYALPKEYIEEENSHIYINRFAKPEEIANTIYYLSNPESSYINGEIINIDGGY